MNHTPAVVNPYLYLERNAAEDPEGLFALSKDSQLTNHQANALTRKIASYFRELGVKPGDLVALDLPGVLTLVFAEACFFVGAVSAEIPFAKIAPGVPFKWSFSTNPDSPYHPLGAEIRTIGRDTLAHIEGSNAAVDPYEYSSLNNAMRLSFSSGTTGLPKAITLNFGGFQSITEPHENQWMSDLPCITQMSTGSLFGFAIFCVSVQLRVPMLLLRGATANETLEMARRIGVRSIKGAPTQIASISDHLEEQGQTLDQIRSIFMAGAPMSNQARVRAQHLMPNSKFQEIYGSTECLALTHKYLDSPITGFVGYPGRDAELQIVDDEGQEVAQGEIGRIRARHLWMCTEYVGSPGEFERHCAEGWYYPGDLGYIHKDGGLVLAGRVSEVLNAGGVKVDPNLLDETALRFRGVADAAAFLVRDERGLDCFAMAIVPTIEFDAQRFVTWVREQLDEYSPKMLVKVDQIPRTATGKTLRGQLSDEFGS